jgi:ABC-type Mn2+/Zn2+ transport system permease subunit
LTAALSILAEAGVWERFWEYPFYQYALAGGIAIALMCSVLSVFVVLKRMAFIGEGIAHAGFGGMGVAMLVGLFLPDVRPALARDAIVAAFCIATAIGIGLLSRRGKLTEDTAIGICLVAAMALGVLLLDVRDWTMNWMIARGWLARGEVGFAVSFHHLMFGNILLVRPEEVVLAWILAGAILAAVIGMFKELVFFAFDEEAAAVFGVRTNMLYYGLLVCLGLAVVAAMRSLGVILCSALLIIPGAAGRFWSRRIGQVALASVLIGVLGLTIGFFVSIRLGFASPGPIIVLTLCVLFVLSWILRAVRARRGTPPG